MLRSAVGDRVLEDWNGERLLVERHAPTGSWILIAIHSTVLGPAAGGTRMKPYPSLDEALDDVLRLSAGMTYKFATPALEFGGGKAVLMVPADLGEDGRTQLLRRYGELVADLDGAFLTGPDVGTTPVDMDVIADAAGGNVFCRTPAAGGAGDPGPYTALGVFTAIEVACEHLGIPLSGARVVVQGAGDVGGPLIERLRAAGAAVAFSEVDDGRIRRFRDESGVEFIPAAEVLEAECDVLSPCALGGVINEDSIAALRCKAVVGSANNQLRDERNATSLQERGILYAPDFVANVGGAMAMTGIEALGWGEAEARANVTTYVAGALRAVIAAAGAEAITTDAAARRIARQRIDDRLRR